MRRPSILVALAILVGVAVACSGSDDASDNGVSAEEDRAQTAAETSTDDSADASQDSDLRIVSMSPTATETLFAIGAGQLVVAVDDQSDYPPEAPLSDLSGFGPSVEAIAAYEPDLVVMWFDPGDVQAGLEELGIEVLFQSAAVDMTGVYSQITELGSATGHSEEALVVVEAIEDRLKQLMKATPEWETPLRYYHEVDSTLYTLTSQTFAGALYAMFGLDNIADPADDDGSAYGYPQLSEEYIIDADPDLIFLGDSAFAESAETLAARPGWNVLSAVRTGSIVALDADVSGRWGPRVIDYAEAIAAAVWKMPYERRYVAG